jgi:hypothetical protein
MPKAPKGATPRLGRVDGFDQDEAESKRDERAVILRRLLASKCDTLEAFELANRLFDACPCLVECFRKEGGHIFVFVRNREQLAAPPVGLALDESAVEQLAQLVSHWAAAALAQPS